MTGAGYLLAPAAATVLAAVVACYAIGRKSLWYDETVSAWLARAPRPVFWSSLAHHEANMSGYFLALRI